MTNLNQGVANSPDEDASLQRDEYWRFMERSADAQQFKYGYYIPLVKTVTEEGGNISGNDNFQISPNVVFSVNDLHDSYLKLDVEM
jgi:hypothetical protein